MGVWDTIENYLRNSGLSDAQVRGVAAGIYAESKGDPTAVNPTSGAFGIGQWLGSRKAELRRRYGNSPSLMDQLEFLVWELKGGDHGGKSVLSSSTEESTLYNYITKFMRPAKGAETTGDLQRGSSYLGGTIRGWEKGMLDSIGLDGSWWTDPNASLTDLDPTGVSGFIKSFFTGEMAGRFAAVIIGVILVALAIAAFVLTSDTGKQVIKVAATKGM